VQNAYLNGSIYSYVFIKKLGGSRRRHVTGASKTCKYSLRKMAVTSEGKLLMHKREVFSNLLQFVL